MDYDADTDCEDFAASPAGRMGEEDYNDALDNREVKIKQAAANTTVGRGVISKKRKHPSSLEEKDYDCPPSERAATRQTSTGTTSAVSTAFGATLAKNVGKESTTKRKRQSSSEGAVVPKEASQKRLRKLCSADGCTNIAKKGGVCKRHGAMILCSREGCTNYAVKGGVCIRHGQSITMQHRRMYKLCCQKRSARETWSKA